MSFEFKETPLKTVSLTVWSNPAYMKANERERMLAYICEYDGKCPMYEKGKCVCQNLIFGEIKCPHARRVQASGLTKRASGFDKAASRWKEMYKTEIQIENVMLCECGAYIMGADVVVPENYGMGQLVRAIKQAGYKAFKLETMRVLVKI